jgi:hypothetical protein
MRVRYSFSSRKTGRVDLTNVHKKPVPRLVKEVIGMSDIILEVLDARFIEETRNREMEEIVAKMGKKLIFVLNKADLADMDGLKDGALEGIGLHVFFSCKTKLGRGSLRTLLKIEAKRLKKKEVKIGVIGYPNTGKSSLINLLAGRSAAGVAAEAGFTKGMQKIRIARGIILLDTPGVMPEEEAPAHRTEHAKKLSIIGVKTWDKVKNPEFVVFQIAKENPGLLERFYRIDAKGDSEVLVEELGKRNRFLTKGGIVDIDRTARFILRDWQDGKIRVKKNNG